MVGRYQDPFGISSPQPLKRKGDLLTVAAGPHLTRLAIGDEDDFLQVSSGLPIWRTFDAAGIPSWTKYTVTHTDLQTASTSNDIELFSLVAKGVIHVVKIKHTTAFSGGLISAYTVSVGISGNLTRYAGAFDVFQAVADTTFQLGSALGGEDEGSATSIRVAAVSTGANLDQTTAGSVDISVLSSVTP